MEKQLSFVNQDTIFVKWEAPRRFAVGLFYKAERGGPQHLNIGVLASSVDRAIIAVQQAYPDYRIESVNDTGSVTIVVDVPTILENQKK